MAISYSTKLSNYTSKASPLSLIKVERSRDPLFARQAVACQHDKYAVWKGLNLSAVAQRCALVNSQRSMTVKNYNLKLMQCFSKI